MQVILERPVDWEETNDEFTYETIRRNFRLGLTGEGYPFVEFDDGGKTSPWAKDAMAWAVSAGLFQGDDNGALNPGGEATRAQVATLLQRLVGLIVK